MTATEDEPRPVVSQLSAALWFGEQGLRIFPLSPGSKIPYKGSNGCLDASSNADVIRGWWDYSPDANIGIATGFLVDVVDIDGPAGQASRAAHWDDTFARVEELCVAKVLSPRAGGMHIYVPAQGDGNSASLLPGIDYRGAGGFVVAPPSVLIEGKCKPTDTPGPYRFLGIPNFTVPERAASTEGSDT